MNDEERAARIIRNPTFQALQSWFSKTYGVGTGIFDRWVHPLTFEVNHKDYCACVRKEPDGFRRCRLSDADLIHACEKTKRVCWHVCRNGLLDLGIPIKMNGKPVAFLLAGQLRGEFRGYSTEKRANTNLGVSLTRAFEDIPVLDAEHLERVDQAARHFGDMLSGLLTALRAWRPAERSLRQYLERARNAKTVDELLEISVDFFPRIIGSEECSIFCVGEDVDQGKRLILRKTSYDPLKKMEGTGYYEFGEGLTGWVWKHGRSLRLNDLANEAELVSVHPGDPPKWSGKLRDSPRRREFLCVPIFGRAPGEAVGAVRTPVKPGGFSVDDEITLSALGDYLYSLLELCERRERAADVEKAFEVALSLQRCASQTDIWRTLLCAAVSFFGGQGKAYLINLLEHRGDSFIIGHVDGDLASKNLAGREYPLRGTTTGYVLRTGEPLLIHSVSKAKSEKRYVPAVSRGCSGMAAPIRCNGGRYLGAIGVVASKRYAFNREDLELLRHLAELAGKSYDHVTSRSAVAETEKLRLLSKLLHGLMHDLGIPMMRVDASLRKRFPPGSLRDELVPLTAFLLIGLEAYQFAPAVSQEGEFMGLEESLIQKVRDHAHAFSLGPLIDRCVTVLDTCQAQRPRIVVRCPRNYRVTAEPDMLTIIIYNLLKNSRGHADERKLAEIEIDLSVRRKGRYTILSVSDHNAPLPKDVAENLSQFRPKQLGLALSSLFTHAHAGPLPTGRGTLSYRRVRSKNVFTVHIRG